MTEVTILFFFLGEKSEEKQVLTVVMLEIVTESYALFWCVAAF